MPVFTLDRIIVTEDIAIAECGVHLSPLSREASDHLPIWARLSLVGGAASDERRHIALTPGIG
jgi:endonuclease/exonuclease/phosphatase family metal-dependent hydrolase